jgi:hypothetical protein
VADLGEVMPLLDVPVTRQKFNTKGLAARRSRDLRQMNLFEGMAIDDPHSFYRSTIVDGRVLIRGLADLVRESTWNPRPSMQISRATNQFWIRSTERAGQTHPHLVTNQQVMDMYWRCIMFGTPVIHPRRLGVVTVD